MVAFGYGAVLANRNFDDVSFSYQKGDRRLADQIFNDTESILHMFQ